MSTSIEQAKHAMKPTRWVLFWRWFFPYQLLRFIVINVRMLVMIWKSHYGTRRRPHTTNIDKPTRKKLKGVFAVSPRET